MCDMCDLARKQFFHNLISSYKLCEFWKARISISLPNIHYNLVGRTMALTFTIITLCDDVWSRVWHVDLDGACG